MKIIKVHGVQRAATNYTNALIELNFKDVVVPTSPFGWKHGPPLTEAFLNKKMLQKNYNEFKPLDYIDVVVIIKNPYSWKRSIQNYRKQWDKKFDFEEWYGKYNRVYRSYAELYDGNRNSFSNIYRKVIIIRYEDLLRDAKNIMIDAAAQLNYNIKKQITIPSKVHMSKKWSPKETNFYLKDDNFGLSDAEIRKISDLVDWEIITSHYGYLKI